LLETLHITLQNR